MMWLVCSFSVFVLRRRAYYLQHTPVVGKSRHSAFLALRRQALVGLPAYVSQENPLLCRTLYRFQVDLSVCLDLYLSTV